MHCSIIIRKILLLIVILKALCPMSNQSGSLSIEIMSDSEESICLTGQSVLLSGQSILNDSSDEGSVTWKLSPSRIHLDTNDSDINSLELSGKSNSDVDSQELSGKSESDSDMSNVEDINNVEEKGNNDSSIKSSEQISGNFGHDQSDDLFSQSSEIIAEGSDFNTNSVYEHFPEKQSFDISAFETFVRELTPNELKKMSPEDLLLLSDKWGLALKDAVHGQAALEMNSVRPVLSNVNPVDVLQSKSEPVKPVIRAIISLTGKPYFGDPESEEDKKLATLILTALEAIEKASNFNCVPSFSKERALQQLVAHGSKVIPPQNIGGGRTFFESNIPLDPIPMYFLGILASDNSSRKPGDLQHYGRIGIERKTKHKVLTHNVRFILPNDEKETNDTFQREEVMPKNTVMNCLLRPMDGNEDICFERMNIDFNYGLEMTHVFLEKILEEVMLQQKLGGGLTAMEREIRDQQFGNVKSKFYCPRCPSSQAYIPTERTICNGCGFNATFFPIDENPYRQYGMPEGDHVEALWVEQEPLDVEPAGKIKLRLLMEELRNYWPLIFKSFAFTGDAYPAVSSAKEQSDSIHCKDHDEVIDLADKASLKDHVDCTVEMPYEDVHFISGESHEEMKMHRTALSINRHLGLDKFLLALGRMTTQSQVSATKSGKLVNLYPITHCFTLGTLQALCVVYVNAELALGNTPTVDGWIKFSRDSKDLSYVAQMKVMIEVNIPVELKRIAIRVNNTKLADAATALFAPILFATPSTFYREFVKHKYTNGSWVPGQKDRFTKPKTVRSFLEENNDTDKNYTRLQLTPNEMNIVSPSDLLQNRRDEDLVVENTDVPVLNLPTEHEKYTKWKNEHRFISFSSQQGEAEGVDFKQEAIILKVLGMMAKGKFFDLDVFQRASRLTYYRYCDGQDQTTKRKNPHFRYANEIRRAGTLVLRQGLDPDVDNGLGSLHPDILKLRSIGMNNMKLWISARYKAIPGGKIRVKKVSFTKAQKIEDEKIENMIKDEIRELIKAKPLLDNELQRVLKKAATKSSLVNLYYEVEERILAENLATMFGNEEAEDSPSS